MLVVLSVADSDNDIGMAAVPSANLSVSLLCIIVMVAVGPIIRTPVDEFKETTADNTVGVSVASSVGVVTAINNGKEDTGEGIDTTCGIVDEES